MRTKKELQIISLNILSRREHTCFELKQKLLKHTSDMDLITDVLLWACEENYLSEERFVQIFIRSKAQKGYGPLWIKQALKAKQIKADLIQKYLFDELDTSEINWIDLAKKVYRKKFADMEIVDLNDKAKRQRFLQARGFSVEHFQDLR